MLGILIGILLSPLVMILPAILRYLIVKKPINKGIAILIVGINAIIFIIVFMLVLGFGFDPSLPGMAVAMGSFTSYRILNS